MKKSTILTFATAAAIVATSAGTFAAWDKLSDTKSTTLTIRNPVTVKAQTTEVSLESKTALEALPVYEGNATFDLENVPEGYKIEPTVLVKNGESAVDANKLTIQKTVTGGENVGKDEKSKTVEVSITPTDSAIDLAGQPLNVEITAKLVKVASEN